MPLAALFVVQVRRSQPLYLLCPTALLESLRMFEMVVGKDAKHLFQYDFSLRRNSLCDQSLPCPRTNWKVPTMFCGFAAPPATFHFVLCTIYIIAETAPNGKYLRTRKKASARGAADTSYGTNHRTVLKQDFLLRPLYRFLRQEEPSIPGKPILQRFRLSSQALR